MMLAPPSPPAAYREDLAAAPGRDEFGPSDALWLAIGCFLTRLILIPPDVRGELVGRYERALAQALSSDLAGVLPDRDLARVAELRAAFAATPRREATARVAAVVQDLAAEMEAAGALRLAYSVLFALGAALPEADVETACGVLLRRAGTAKKLGAPETAEALYARVLADAAAAGLTHLAAEAERARGAPADGPPRHRPGAPPAPNAPPRGPDGE